MHRLPNPTRRSFLTGLLAAPLAALAPGALRDTEAAQVRAWLAANDCFSYRPIDVPVRPANDFPADLLSQQTSSRDIAVDPTFFWRSSERLVEHGQVFRVLVRSVRDCVQRFCEASVKADIRQAEGVAGNLEAQDSPAGLGGADAGAMCDALGRGPGRKGEGIVPFRKAFERLDVYSGQASANLQQRHGGEDGGTDPVAELGDKDQRELIRVRENRVAREPDREVEIQLGRCANLVPVCRFPKALKFFWGHDNVSNPRRAA